jgi:hypothetical protein
MMVERWLSPQVNNLSGLINAGTTHVNHIHRHPPEGIYPMKKFAIAIAIIWCLLELFTKVPWAERPMEHHLLGFAISAMTVWFSCFWYYILFGDDEGIGTNGI